MITEKIGLAEHFKDLEDPRSRDCPHNFFEILIISICAVICGMETWEEMRLLAIERQDWFTKTVGLKLEHGIPSKQTFMRVISAIDPLKFQEQFIAWAQAVSKNLQGVVAIDGKTCCGSSDTTLGKRPLHIVSAWCQANGITLGQLAVDEKSNEITAIPKLLDMLVLKGCIITIDAMGCQKEIAAKIIAEAAHYVFGLKGNQGFFAQQVRDHLDKIFDSGDVTNIEHSFYESPATVDHGRIEKRKALAILIKPEDREYDSVQQWAGLKSAVLIERTRIDKATKKESVERAYYISSLEPDAQKLLECSKAHWEVENKLHWMLDVNFGEDASKIRTGDAPHNLSAIRKVSLYHLKQETSQKLSIKSKQKKAALSTEYLEKVLATTLSVD